MPTPDFRVLLGENQRKCLYSVVGTANKKPSYLLGITAEITYCLQMVTLSVRMKSSSMYIPKIVSFFRLLKTI